MRPTAIFHIRRITSYCTDPIVAERKLRGTMKLAQTRISAMLRRNLLEKLIKKDIGTNQVERIAQHLTDTGRRCGFGRNRKLIKILMQQKMMDARKDLEIVEHRYHRARQDLWTIMPYHSREAYEAHTLIRCETDIAYKTGREKIRRKIYHLFQKYGDKVPDTIDGIKITDKALGDRRPLPDPVIVNVEVTNNAKETLQLPPKTATYGPINMIECETEIEKMLVKLKWEKRSEAEREEVGASKQEWEEMKRQDVEIHDLENATINFNRMRVTQLPTNPEIKIPRDLPQAEELKCHQLKQELLSAVRMYRAEFCDERGNIKERNLSSACTRGIKDIRRMCRKGDIVCYPTDKSNRLSLQSTESYIQSAQPHIQGDRILSEDEMRKIEKTLEGHTFQAAKLIGLCNSSGDTKRLAGALLNANITPPSTLPCYERP